MDLVIEIASAFFFLCVIDTACFMQLKSIYGSEWHRKKIMNFASLTPFAIIALLLYWLGRNLPKDSNAPGK